MLRLWLFFVCGVLMNSWLPSAPVSAQTPANSLILSKDLGGTLAGKELALTLRANPACDQTGAAFPDETRLLADDLEFVTDRNSLGVVHGTVRFVAPDGQLLQVMTLRGTFGLNARREAGQDCRSGHLEAQLEPVPTFAPPNVPQIALATLSADVIPEAAGPLPAYRAKLDGVVTLPVSNTAARVTINPDKSTFGESETITAVITNGLNQAIVAEDMKSYCTIVRLQRQEGSEWTDVGECLMRRRSFAVTIAAGQTVRIPLLPGENAATQRQPGNYRLLLDYSIVKGNAPSEAGQAASPSFRVSNMPVREGVRLILEQLPRYVGEGFAARVLNDSGMSIQTPDHKTHCTILDIERLENGVWKKFAPCLSLGPTRLVILASGESQTIKLPAAGADVFPAGTYRAALSYQILNPQGPEGQPVSAERTVYSPEFTLTAR